MGKILDLVGEFDGDFRESLEQETQGAMADAVNGIVDNRHQIAHGKQTGISFPTVRSYYGQVLLVIEKIDAQFS